MNIFALATMLISGTAATANAEAPAAAEQPQPAPTEIARPDVQAMTIAEIRKFNTTVPSKHRYYIVCRQSAVTGSLAQVKRVCQTREDWERRTREAQDSTNDVIERGRASAGCDPLCAGANPT